MRTWEPIQMNSFDAVLYFALAAAVVLGFRSGLLRSAATILGYLIAMPVALWVTSWIVPRIDTGPGLLPGQNSLVFVAAFLVSGIVLGGLLRSAINEIAGDRIGAFDRFGGAALGAVRIGLVAVTVVLVFDALIPVHATPAFLVGSQLRPLLSAAAQRGVKSLPPEAASYIERLKLAQRI
jgi:membrane protein required for colicin V production